MFLYEYNVDSDAPGLGFAHVGRHDTLLCCSAVIEYHSSQFIDTDTLLDNEKVLEYSFSCYDHCHGFVGGA